MNLHHIFQYLVDDEQFLSAVVEKQAIKKKLKEPKDKFDFSTEIMIDTRVLNPYEIQHFRDLPKYVRQYIQPNFSRYGIRNMGANNNSMVAALNILLRPEIYSVNVEEFDKYNMALSEFLCHSIERNYQIDKTRDNKNTKKIQTANKQLTTKLNQGIIVPETLQYVANIYEINLMIFDLTEREVYFYWAKSNKYPHLNLYNKLFCMIRINANYEPLMTSNNQLAEEEKISIYTHILIHADRIIFHVEPKLSTVALMYLNTWDLPFPTYFNITNYFFRKKILTA